MKITNKSNTHLVHGVNTVESRALGYSGFTSPGGCSRLVSTSPAEVDAPDLDANPPHVRLERQCARSDSNNTIALPYA